MRVEIDLPEVEGFEYTGEYRSVNTGEYYRHMESPEALHCEESESKIRFILRKKRWRATGNDIYWSVTNRTSITDQYDHGTCHDDELYEVGNYFKTEEEAQAMADKIKKLLKED